MTIADTTPGTTHRRQALERHPSPNTETPAGPCPSLVNDDLAPLRKQKWGSYNIFAFWMSDVHSVGGYVTAGTLFALGLTAWQVLLALLVGISLVYVFCNLVSEPSQKTGTPFPVVCRGAFGVRGANVPAFIRGVIAVAWYGIQTYLASHALVILALKLWPQLGPWAEKDVHGFLGLSALGWAAFAIMWVLQALVFWRGMEAIRRFIDFCGPAVYVVMFALAAYLVAKAGWSNISLTLTSEELSGWPAVVTFFGGVALVVSYFSGPMLNFGDIARYGSSGAAVRRGNFLGLPVNFLVFSVLVVLTASATVPVYGGLITDPVETVARLDNGVAVALGALTFTIATIGINIVANFIAPAFDFSNIAPRLISWRAGGMIAAVGSVLLTPWNLYSSPEVIHYTLDTLAAFIGPVFGVLVTWYWILARREISVRDLFTSSPTGRYHYHRGWNLRALAATVIAAAVAMSTVLVPALQPAANFSWFIGAGLAAALNLWFHRGWLIRVSVADSDGPDSLEVDSLDDDSLDDEEATR
ncbi:NCS1 family nucleobase:cation symporter-1 [uncultured Corynebacterium sp.]|uniref:NCS1 family nucleobase:cation symporter-1 n=1 Tax=uncultured Corynebacterium sp. TaxID=159447 RepID=UPI0025FBB13E|nr:NCS1 family nucleobase:cation symporter-1 [uncultured Corynebacterium sp.]